MLKYTHTLYIWITRINFGQKLSFKNMAFLVSLSDWLYRYLHISPSISYQCLWLWSKPNHITTQAEFKYPWMRKKSSCSILECFLISHFILKHSHRVHKYFLLCFVSFSWQMTDNKRWSTAVQSIFLYQTKVSIS